MVDLPSAEEWPGDLPLLARAIRGCGKCALFCPNQYSYRAHSLLLPGFYCVIAMINQTIFGVKIGLRPAARRASQSWPRWLIWCRAISRNVLPTVSNACSNPGG